MTVSVIPVHDISLFFCFLAIWTFVLRYKMLREIWESQTGLRRLTLANMVLGSVASVGLSIVGNCQVLTKNKIYNEMNPPVLEAFTARLGVTKIFIICCSLARLQLQLWD